MELKYELIFRDSEKYELNSLGIQNSWCKLQDFKGEGKKDAPMELTVIAAKKDGFSSPFYKLLGFCKLSRNKAGDCSLVPLVMISGDSFEDLSTVYFQAYDISENVQVDMKREHELFYREMYKEWEVMSPEVMSRTNETGNAKKVAA